MGVLNNFEDVDFSRNPLNVCDIQYLRFFQYFDSNFGLGEYMHSNFDFSEGSLSNSFAQDVLADFSLMRLEL